MRIRITLMKNSFTIPLAYQSILQGAIYALLSKNGLGCKYHDQGFSYQHKKFKCFVFSQLFGAYQIKGQEMLFHEDFYFYISSQDEAFMKAIYQMLSKNEYLILHQEKVQIKDIYLFDLAPFSEAKNVWIKTLSPLLVCSTKNSFTKYFKPSDSQVEALIIQNIKDKSKAYGYSLENVIFSIKKVHFEKRRMVKFKNCIYPAYLCQMEVMVDYTTLLFLYNCGLSSKNSCGFGMIEVMNEKDNLSL